MTRRWWALIAAMAMVAPVTPGAIASVGPASPAAMLARELAGAGWRQVRIEQHVIIRITPGDPALLRELPPPEPLAVPERMRERRMPPCLPVASIAGVRPLANDRLLLFLRDHRLVGADLARNCTARDFYLGFYVSPTSDGMLCAGRDTIHSRAGSTCMIAKVHELVPRN